MAVCNGVYPPNDNFHGEIDEKPLDFGYPVFRQTHLAKFGWEKHTGSELLITESIKIATKPKSQPTCPYIIDKSLMKSQKLIIDDVTSKNQRFAQNYPNNQSFAMMLAGSLHPRILSLNATVQVTIPEIHSGQLVV